MMKPTPDASARLKNQLKHEPATLELRQEAHLYPVEADEAFQEVETGLDGCRPDSVVAEMIAEAYFRDMPGATSYTAPG